MLTKVVFYAYLQKVYSGRKMETLLRRDVNFIWLSGMQTPDFNTIDLFRKNRLAAVVDDLFTQVVQMLVDQKIISLEVQYVDGTKIEANANKYTFVWKKSTQTNRGKLDRKVKTILAEAEKELGIELGEDRQDVMTPAEMTERTERILDEMDRRGISDRKLRKVVSEVNDAHAEKMREYDEKLEILGERNSYSKTDRGTFINHMDTFKKRYGKQSSKVVADSGYGNEQNYEYLIANNVEGFVKYKMFHAEQKRRHADNPFLPDNMFYNKEEDYYVCPMGQHLEHSHDSTKVTELGYVFNTSTYRAKDCSRCPVRGFCYKAKPDRRTIEVNHRNNELKAQARERLMSEKGMYHRSMRPVEPEAVFGQIKYDGGFKRFRYRGSALTSAEFATVAIAHNIKKMISVMDAERNGRRLSPPRDVPPAARKRVPTSAACCGSRA